MATNCFDEELESSDEGDFLVVSKFATDDCPYQLTGSGIPVSDGSLVKMRDGSAADPITLPELEVIQETGTFPFLMLSSEGGSLKRFDADDAVEKKYLVSEAGSFKLSNPDAQICYDLDDICGNCQVDYIAGWTEADGRLCLNRFPLAELSVDALLFADTNTIDVQGIGTSGNPYNFHLKLSPDAGNPLEVRVNGLHCPISADVGNILELRADGLFVGCCYYDAVDGL